MRNRELRNIAGLTGIAALVVGISLAVVGLYTYGEGMGGNLLGEFAGILIEVSLIFLVLDWIVEKKEKREWQFAYQVISQRMAITFVDIMRLLYVASSDIGRQHNIERYQEFIDLAEQHFGDLRSHIEGFSVAFDVHTHQRCRQLELKLSWILNRLKQGPELGWKMFKYFKTMHKVGVGVNEFFVEASGDSYQREVTKVRKNLDGIKIQAGSTTELLSNVFRLRLNIQSNLLEEGRDADGEIISSIADDINQSFAIPYFILDYLLLREIATSIDNA